MTQRVEWQRQLLAKHNVIKVYKVIAVKHEIPDSEYADTFFTQLMLLKQGPECGCLDVRDKDKRRPAQAVDMSLIAM
ncbi:uncharacterized protein PHALS_14998 [Plasmopara halstedii]|uniref:Uncharacterized protein n=1 Tax=Plasmopara halstedii TaxID=4781 RepID=A0A0P1B1Y6_PLAHL|nr:uncharacterized protein PHALS_14998 [Plasmopara halstedii]CEG47393.1 hypothetical protein PHALS_14998 [Plasmopara halstedii]|eukprot:XP_024583762.1 hypothetical protein PHALS_14998 [Plasmopara halstedii]